ncbi:TPA: hypothetical protein DCF80_02600 [Candidatus Saccharibacteria bacterium]|nr:hypothetical protein [Candidatus Saccharibacteria bacterium]HRK40571.1 hypothetical protein [Candidatus Saccharibacteria bacterium]
MKSFKTLTRNSTLLAIPALLIGIFTVVTFAPATANAAPTTWQAFINKKCGGMSADAWERCANSLRQDLRSECGAEKENDTYIRCWRKFIRDNGGTASSSSSPFEEETPVGTGGSGCGSVSTNIIDCDSTGGDPVSGLVIGVINFLAVGVGIAVVGGIIWGGMLYASSNGDPGKTKQGISVIVNAIIGLLLFIFMYAILNFIVPGGLFT